MDKKILVLLILALASGCTTESWDRFFYAEATPATHLITGQLIAELARDQK
jgi:hypothetical protein